METQICGQDGLPIDAAVEININTLTLQSRGGTKGTSQAKNTDYSLGLRMLFKRLQRQDLGFLEAYVDSSRVQDLPLEDRRVLAAEELNQIATDRLFTLVSKRIQAVGKVGAAKRHTGNANKRLKFRFSDASIENLIQIVRQSPDGIGLSVPFHLSSAEQIWTEGRTHLVSHLQRERASGLARAKKEAFIRDNGRLFCERCNLDPVDHYGDPIAESCIEIHHCATHVSDMQEGHVTRLQDLVCLCANCHRLVHAMLKEGALK